jgi:hypothetical protein
MSRSWFGRLLFVLALAIQVFSPAAANVAQSNAGPLNDQGKTAFQICLKTAADYATGDRQSPGLPERHGGSCAFCQVFCDGAPAFGATVTEVGLAPVQWRFFAWTVADRALPTPRDTSSHQPRAPPKYS